MKDKAGAGGCGVGVSSVYEAVDGVVMVLWAFLGDYIYIFIRP